VNETEARTGPVAPTDAEKALVPPETPTARPTGPVEGPMGVSAVGYCYTACDRCWNSKVPVYAVPPEAGGGRTYRGTCPDCGAELMLHIATGV